MSGVILSSGMAGTVVDCSTLAVLRTEGYTTATGKESAPMEAGKAVHRAGELWLGGYPVDDCLQRFTESYKEFSDSYVTMDDRLAHDNIKDILNVVYSNMPLTAQPFTVEEIFTEKQFMAEVIKNVHFTTKPDGVVRYKHGGQLFVFELKTMSRIDKAQMDRYLMDGQITAHVDVMRRNGFNVDGVILLAIQMNKLPAPIKNKCKEHKIPQWDCRNDHVKFEKYILTRNDHQINDWETSLAIVGERYEKALETVRSLGFDDGIKLVPTEGQFHGICTKCFSRDFCSNGKQFNNFTKAEREEGIIHSGLYNSEHSTAA